MRKWADCRKCVYFIPYLKGEKTGVLGFCRRWKKEITYYEGYCRGFETRDPLSKSLLEFIRE